MDNKIRVPKDAFDLVTSLDLSDVKYKVEDSTYRIARMRSRTARDAANIQELKSIHLPLYSEWLLVLEGKQTIEVFNSKFILY